jgi:hypothetical protein
MQSAEAKTIRVVVQLIESLKCSAQLTEQYGCNLCNVVFRIDERSQHYVSTQ